MCRFGNGVTDFHDITVSLSNGGNYYQQSGAFFSYGWDFTPQQGKLTVGVSFREAKSFSPDPSTTTSVEFDVLQGDADVFWKGYQYYPYTADGCAAGAIAQGRIFGLGMCMCVIDVCLCMCSPHTL